ncbi:hypothetical protein CMEL01_12990 [Colletotrichum melonis]|uniref:Uncharacterized protein n=1 Tax=Colletotrichum melonis TaxID=1209925 RepID=A0AAI9UT40_9PEZI|nr:hypothetical protein CMEL01_12990 [Colletotrichum melonis]
MYTQTLPIQYGSQSRLNKALAQIVGDGNFAIHGVGSLNLRMPSFHDILTNTQYVDNQWYFQTSRLLSPAEIAAVKVKMKGHASRRR